MVGAYREFVYIEKFVSGCRKLGADLESLSDKGFDGYLQKEIKRFTKMLAVPSAVNTAPATANMSARRLKQSVKRRL